MASSLHVNEIENEEDSEMTGSLADVLSMMHILWNHLTKHCDTVKESDPIETADKIEKAIEKLDKYWNMMIKTPVYLMSVICDPRRNLD